MTDEGLQDRRTAARAAQAELVAAKAPFAAIACPGAGKTRLIVDRHVTQPVPARQGRAIASFTRVAAAEVHQRCTMLHRLDLVDHPHFVDTLDTFIWLHLVRPFLPAGRQWQRLESWRDAPAARRQFFCGSRPYRIEDVHFQVDSVGRWSASPTGPARWQPLPEGWHWRADQHRRRLAEDGYLTGVELRAHACTNLTTHGTRLGQVLTAKYAELVVDEAQDCAPVDLHILSRLHDLGLPIVMVADPDQAIYGFRGAASDELVSIAERLGRCELTGNWRSTSIICRIAATLRTSGRPADNAVADHHAETTPVLLYSATTGDTAVADFLDYAARLGISASDCMIMAHAQSSLPKSYAGSADPPSGNTNALVWAVGILTELPAAPSKTRAHARDILTRTVLRWWYPDADGHTITEALATYNLESAAIDRLLYRLLAAMPALDQPLTEWTAAATTVLTAHPPASGLTRAGSRLTAPKNKATMARRAAGLPPRSTQGNLPRLSTVHQAKGDEAEAVLVCIPNNATAGATTIEAWITGHAPDASTAEALRVLYVAVTRARRLLALTVPATHRGRLAACLADQDVPVELR
ncbi:UvrD-helicase domain-containing protein [Micromonospora purpureochromogenes]|uniref:UvrD-helicase domain-containing protein n=1 Tax=Micromonospora purpureochromogenes TaxID=47872 RepID=UPI0033FBF242